MARFAQVLADAIQTELGVDERDARIAAGLLVSVHRQVFRARAQAGARRTSTAPPRSSGCAPTCERAYELLEHGLGDLLGGAGRVPQAG